MRSFAMTVGTTKDVESAVQAVVEATQQKGFRVLHIHDVAATLAEKGFQREPVRIIEICNAKYASQVLDKDISLALMLPCPITVYAQDGRTHISGLLPTSMIDLFPNAGLDEVAEAVEKVVVEIINESR